jgi:propanediol utilization protein
MIDVDVPGETPLVVEKVVVRVHPSFRANIHLDVDEANAAALSKQGETGRIVGVHPQDGAPIHFMGDA